MSDFQEFPKILHLGGDLNAKHVIVNSDEEEEAAEGYFPVSFDEPAVQEGGEAPKKRGRPAKAQ